jgi:hypothetical protein
MCEYVAQAYNNLFATGVDDELIVERDDNSYKYKEVCIFKLGGKEFLYVALDIEDTVKSLSLSFRADLLIDRLCQYQSTGHNVLNANKHINFSEVYFNARTKLWEEAAAVSQNKLGLNIHISGYPHKEE